MDEKAWLAEAATAADKSFRGALDDPSLTPKQSRHRRMDLGNELRMIILSIFCSAGGSPRLSNQAHVS